MGLLNMKPVPIKPKKNGRLLLILIILVIVVVSGVYIYRNLISPNTGRWGSYAKFLSNPEEHDEILIKAGSRCDDSPFAFPTDGVVFGFWKQSYGLRTTHTGLDIFSGAESGATPIYAAYDGYLTRKIDWVSTVIIRIPHDPLDEGRQIWTYYTHMADVDGNSFISEEFPKGTSEEWVKAGTLLGYMGNYSGNPIKPTGIHLHFSIVKDDGTGYFLNETKINNTIDSSPYFNLPVNQKDNPKDFPVCNGTISIDDWGNQE